MTASLPLMPKATAAWLVENTSLTFAQIAKFCGLHELEIKAFADGEAGTNIHSMNPISTNQLTREEVTRCEQDPSCSLKLKPQITPLARRSTAKRYTPVSKRQEKPDAIFYLLKHFPELTDAQIVKLIGTTKKIITAVRDKSHWNSANLTPKDPVILGLCKQTELNDALAKIRAKQAPVENSEPRESDNKHF